MHSLPGLCYWGLFIFPLLTYVTGKKKPDITFMFQDEIEDCLRKHIQDAPEEFISELAEYLIKQV
jgi:hypothetical protein